MQILYEETLYQNSSDGTPFVKMLQSKNIIPGIKVRGGSGCCSVLCGVLLSCVMWRARRRECGRPGSLGRAGEGGKGAAWAG